MCTEPFSKVLASALAVPHLSTEPSTARHHKGIWGGFGV